MADGDTLRVKCDNRVKAFQVRIAEIDAPELAHAGFGIALQPFGPEAKAELSTLCQGKPAVVRRLGFDQHQRAVGQVQCAGVDVATHQVTAGMAWADTSYLLKGSSMPAIEVQARAARRGLWASDGAIAPWLWRKTKC